MKVFSREFRRVWVALAAGSAIALGPAAAVSRAAEVEPMAQTDEVDLVVESRSLLRDGEPFGAAGPYEQLRGYVAGQVDPDDPANQGIVNLDKAPVNDAGMVEYRSAFEIHKPVDMSRGNQTMLYEVVNRGRALAPGSLDPDQSLLYENGFTMVWSGWQGDLDWSDTGPLAAEFPVATNDGEPIVDLVRDEFVDRGTEPWTGTLSYPAATLDESQATLTVRERQTDPREVVESWDYVGDQEISVTPPGGPYDSGAIYEFIYPGTEPTVLGMGFAAVRDLSSFLVHGELDADGDPNPLGVDQVENAVSLGISQSGRFLRDFVYQGFNQDLAGRQIFDGAMPIIAGSRRIWLNYEFAQPGRWSKQHEEHFQRGDQFPFAYNTIEDPLTGAVDGILKRCSETDTCPKVMHVDGEYEVWGARGSLVVTDGDPDRPRDLKLPDGVRVYMVAGTPHGGSNAILPGTDETGICQQVNTPLGSRPVLRSLFLSLDSWTAHGVQPPPSRYGSANAQTLVPSDRSSTRFPEIPGVTYNGVYNHLRVTDYTQMPPAEGAAYGVLVPRVNHDGNSRAGIRLPALEAPLGTYTGWNIRAEGHAEGDMCGSSGSFIALPETREDRRDAGDPRKSVEERYHSHDDYVAEYARATHKLVRLGYVLPQDAAGLIAEADALQVP